MRTLLIRPFTDAVQGRNPPISLMCLSAYLKSQQLDVRLIDKCVDLQLFDDFIPENPYLQDLLQDIQEYNPDIIGMTLFSREIKSISVLCKRIKRKFPSILIVLGGPHPTAMPHQSLEHIPDCDIVVLGEGELILYELINILSTNKDLKQVKGISFRGNHGHIHHNEKAEIIHDLNMLPFPDKESLIQNYQNGTYGHILYGSPTDMIMTSRGCPFQCKFCFKVCSKYRSRTPSDVIQEIDWIVNHIAPEYIQIMDDSFTIQRERCLAILDALIDKKYPCRFKVRSRVNAVDEEMLGKMKLAGVTTIVYGLESGSQQMLDAFNKKTTVNQNILACQLTRKSGINCFGDMILFYPGETKETLQETKQFIKRAKPHAVQFFVLTPLPNTAIYEEARNNGSLVGDWDGSGKTPWVRLKEFPDIENMQRIAKRMFFMQFLDPARIWWLVKYYGRSTLKRPLFFMKMLMNKFIKKPKY